MVTLLSIPLQGYLFKTEVTLRKQNTVVSYQRVKLTNEILQCIEAIMFYAWERPFASNVEGHGKEEIERYYKVV